MHAFLLLTEDPTALSRPDPNTLPQQTLMELLLGDFDDKQIFRKPDGSFKALGQWKGVTVNDVMEVTQISWAPRNPFEIRTRLVIRDPIEARQLYAPTAKAGGSIDFKWIPSTVRKLAIYKMNLRGTINTWVLPPELDAEFNVSSNSLDGTVDTAGFPRRLWTIDISENNLSGCFDLTVLPPRLRNLNVSENMFCGTADFSRLPEAIWRLNLSKNKFTGRIDLAELRNTEASIFLDKNNFDSQKTLVVRAGVIRRDKILRLDAGDIEEIVDTDGVQHDFRSYNNLIQMI